MGLLDGLNLNTGLEIPLEQGEQIVSDMAASRYVPGGVNIGGHLWVTNYRIIFQASKINLTAKQRELKDNIYLTDVTAYSVADNVGLGNMITIPGVNKDKCVLIKTQACGYQYNIGNKVPELLNVLSEYCDNASEQKKEGYLSNVAGNFLGRNARTGKEQNNTTTKSNGVICSSCGTENMPNTKFCSECGTKLKCNCMNCGSELKSSAKFCDQCGEKL